MFNNFVSKIVRFMDNVRKYCRTGHVTHDNMAQAHCMLDTYGYEHTLRIRNNNCCFSAATMICTKASQCYVTSTLPVLLQQTIRHDILIV